MNWDAPVTIETLKQKIETTDWFTRIGSYPESAKVLALRTLKAAESSSSNEWDWLPTTPTSPDPIHIPSLATIAKQSGRYSDYSIVVAEFIS